MDAILIGLLVAVIIYIPYCIIADLRSGDLPWFNYRFMKQMPAPKPEDRVYPQPPPPPGY